MVTIISRPLDDFSLKPLFSFDHDVGQKKIVGLTRGSTLTEKAWSFLDF